MHNTHRIMRDKGLRFRCKADSLAGEIAKLEGYIEEYGTLSSEESADDGVRLFLDGRLLINQWYDQPVRTHKKIIDLVGRRHDLRLEYYEKIGAAVCQLAFKRLF